MAAIKQAVAGNPLITVIRQTRVSRLVTDDEGICGVQAMILGGAAGKVHRWAEGIANKLTLQVMGLHKPFAAIFRGQKATRRLGSFEHATG